MKQILGYAVIGILAAGVVMAVFISAYGVLWSEDLKKFSKCIDEDSFKDLDVFERGSLNFRKGDTDLMGPYRVDVNEYPGVSRIDFSMDANHGGIEVYFVENPDMIYSFIMETDKGIKEPEIRVYQDGDTLKVDIQIEMEEIRHVDELEDAFNERKVTLSLSRYMLYDVDIKSGAGMIQYEMSDGAEVEDLKLRTDAGMVDLKLERTAKAGVITVNTNVGKIEVDIRDSSFEELNIKSAIGKVNLGLENPRLTGDATVDLESELGEVNSRFILDDDTEASISGSTDLGTVNTDAHDDFSVTSSGSGRFVVESHEYPGEVNLEVSMKTQLGSINLDVER